MIPHDDRGLTLGDGLFETILAQDGALIWLEEHLKRLADGCATLGLPAPDLAQARRLCLQAAATVMGRAAVRLTLTAGSGGRGLDRPAQPQLRLLATAAAAPLPSGPAAMITATVRRNEGSPASGLKTLAYLDNVLARAEARSAGADEALMLNNRGQIACASAANVFWIKGSRLFTPAPGCGVLTGIAREKAIQLAPSLGLEPVEIAEGAQALARVDAIFMTNSLIGVRPVARLDGVEIIGSSASRLVGALQEALARQGVSGADWRHG